MIGPSEVEIAVNGIGHLLVCSELKAGVASAPYNLLFPKMDDAISHAKTVLSSFEEGTTPAKAESATTVFDLAEQLRFYM